MTAVLSPQRTKRSRRDAAWQLGTAFSDWKNELKIDRGGALSLLIFFEIPAASETCHAAPWRAASHLAGDVDQTLQIDSRTAATCTTAFGAALPVENGSSPMPPILASNVLVLPTSICTDVGDGESYACCGNVNATTYAHSRLTASMAAMTCVGTATAIVSAIAISN